MTEKKGRLLSITHHTTLHKALSNTAEQGLKRIPSGLLEKLWFVTLLHVKHFNNVQHFNKPSLDQTNNYLGGTELDGENEKNRERERESVMDTRGLKT